MELRSRTTLSSTVFCKRNFLFHFDEKSPDVGYFPPVPLRNSKRRTIRQMALSTKTGSRPIPPAPLDLGDPAEEADEG